MFSDRPKKLAVRVVQTLTICLSAISIVSCGGGSTATPPPSFTTSCVENLCQFFYDDSKTGLSMQWNLDGQAYNGNDPFIVLFTKSGTHDLKLTDPGTGQSTPMQQVTIAPISEFYNVAQKSLQMVLLYDYSARFLNNFVIDAVPQIVANEQASGSASGGILPCSGGGSLAYTILNSATPNVIQPGDRFTFTPPNSAGCALTIGGTVLGGGATVIYGTAPSATKMKMCAGGPMAANVPDWSAFGISLQVTYQGTNGSVLDLGTDGTDCGAGQWVVTPSDVPSGDTEGAIDLLDVLDFSMTTDANDSSAISGEVSWDPVDMDSVRLAGPFKVQITSPLNIQSDNMGLHMVAGSMTVSTYADYAHWTSNTPMSVTTLSVPPGADTSTLQVSVTDFANGGGTITGTYQQQGMVSLPHTCALNEFPLYCIKNMSFYLDDLVVI